jgi:acetyl-CoA decarbonylase/synthase complex subunit gamma
MAENESKKSVTELSPIQVYILLPRITPPCSECGEKNCMAFAVKAVSREISLEKCTPLLTEKYKTEYTKLKDLLTPPVKEITIGVGENSIKIGGKLVQYRHEFTYQNPTPIAIDVTDEMHFKGVYSTEESLTERIRKIEDFSYNYIGRDLNLDMIAIRSTSNDPTTFKSAIENTAKVTEMPLILCTFDPNVMEAGLVVAHDRRPLIYAATKDNWREMAELALMYNCPLAVFAPNDLNLLRSLSKIILEYGVKDLVLDPGTFTDKGQSDTINNFTMIRRNACKGADELLGFPVIGTPITAWIDKESSKEDIEWREAYVASMLISRYADLLIMHSIDGWVQLPVLIWRFNIYTDPRKPVSVDSGLKIFGNPDKSSPVLLTTNYALTFFTVESDIKKAGVDCYLIVVDTEGISVESSVAGRYLTAETIVEAVNQSGIEQKINHKYLIIPGLAARLSGETEEELKGEWRVLVGPKDSSGIAEFLKKQWPPKKEEE